MNNNKLQRDLFYTSLPYDKEVLFLFYFLNYNIESALKIIIDNQIIEKEQCISYDIKVKNMIILISALSRKAISNSAPSAEIISYAHESINKILSLNLTEELYPIELEIIESLFNIYIKRVQSKNLLIYKIINYININLDSKISVDKIATVLGLSVSYISHAFKKEKNISIKSFIIEQKIERAKQLLSATDLTIEEISSKLKFSNYNYFCKVFKKETGVSPKYYRSLHILKQNVFSTFSENN